MAEYENRTERRGLAGTALGLAAGALGVNLVNGGLGNILGGWTGNCNYGCNENMLVNRYEAQQQAKIAELETEVKLRDSYTFTMGEMGKFRDYVDGKFAKLEKEICDEKMTQAVINAKVESGLNVLSSQVASVTATVANITRTAIPQSAICDFGCGCNNCGNNI